MSISEYSINPINLLWDYSSIPRRGLDRLSDLIPRVPRGPARPESLGTDRSLCCCSELPNCSQGVEDSVLSDEWDSPQERYASGFTDSESFLLVPLIVRAVSGYSITPRRSAAVVVAAAVVVVAAAVVAAAVGSVGRRGWLDFVVFFDVDAVALEVLWGP